jgi:hypothetical protein
MLKPYLCILLGLLVLSAYAQVIPSVEIPTYEGVQAAELTIQIQLYQDGSYLIQATEPEELRSYADEYLFEHELKNLLAEEQMQPGKIEIRVPIVYVQADEPPLTMAELRELIDAWIVDQREADSTTKPLQDWLNPMASELLLYKTVTSAVGLTTGSQRVALRGFDLACSAVEPYVPLTWQQSMGISSDMGPYPYEPLFSSIHAGMGEYDSRFAIFRLAKNHLLGKRGMYYALDMQVANGDWLDRNNAETSMRHRLNLPLGPVGLNLEYASFDQDLSSLTLKSAYPLASIFTIQRQGEYAWAELANKWLNLSFLRSREALKSAQFPAQVKSLNYQAQAQKTLQFGNHELDASWIHLWPKSDYSFPMQPNYEDKGSLAWRYNPGGLETKLRVDLYDLKDVSTDASIGYAWSRVKLSGGWEKAWTEPEVPKQISDIFNPGSLLDNAEIVTRADKWLQVDTDWNSLKLSLRAGQKEYSQTLLQAEQSFTPYYLGLGTKLNWDIKIAKLHLMQNLLYVHADDALRNTPALRGFGELKLSRDLGHNNSIYLALSYLFHTDYKTLYQPSESAGFALIGDARLGVRISKAFEIEALARNLGNNYIFGQMALPLSLHASLKWYFVN